MQDTVTFIKRRMIKPVLLVPVAIPKRWAVIRAFITGLPIIVMGCLRWNFSGETPPWYQEKLHGAFDTDWKVFLLIASPVVLSLVLEFYEWIGEWLNGRGTDFMPSVIVVSTLASLNNVIGRKLDRYGKMAKRVATAGCPTQEVFPEILQPHSQIEELVEQIWTILTKITENPHLKVVLVEISGGQPVKYAGYCPRSKRPSESLLNESGSFFAYVAKNNSFQVIPDIAQYVRKRSRLTNREQEKRFPISFACKGGTDNAGSICGFPVFHSHLDKVVYVLTVMDDKPLAIDGSAKKKFGPVLNHFFMRVLLEYNTKVLQGYVDKKTS